MVTKQKFFDYLKGAKYNSRRSYYKNTKAGPPGGLCVFEVLLRFPLLNNPRIYITCSKADYYLVSKHSNLNVNFLDLSTKHGVKQLCRPLYFPQAKSRARRRYIKTPLRVFPLPGLKSESTLRRSMRWR
jgi:hypothetical protein